MGVGACACWALIFWHLNALNDHPSGVAIPLGIGVDLAPIKPWAVVVGQHLFGRHLISVGVEVGSANDIRDLIGFQIRISLS